MALSPDTLHKIADASPFPAGRYGELGMAGVVQRWEDAGLMRYLFERSYSENDAFRVCDDAPNPEREVDRLFFRGQERFYLKADFRTVEGSRIADAVIARIGREDQDAADDYQQVLQTNGVQGLFKQVDVDVRRHDLGKVAIEERGGDDLASVEQGMARRNQGRRM